MMQEIDAATKRMEQEFVNLHKLYEEKMQRLHREFINLDKNYRARLAEKDDEIRVLETLLTVTELYSSRLADDAFTRAS